jgi:uncharacterized membrane protein YoaK (UPF0700 family)
MLTRWAQRDTNTAALLCVAGGIADAIGYVQAGVFAANMTGNTVLTGISLANADFVTALDRALTFVTFFAGAMLGRLSLRFAKSAWLPLFIEAAILAVSTFLLERQSLAILLIAFAMGIQATAITKFKGAAISTIVLTSTLARLAEATLDFFARHKRLSTVSQKTPAALLAVTWVAYAVGAMLAILLLKVTQAPLLVAAAIVLALSYAYWRRDKIARQ